MADTKTNPQKDQNHDQNQDPKFSQEKYSVAITLIQAQVQLFWLIFGAFLLSETVLLAAVTSIDKNDSNNLIFWGSILGILISLLWLTTFNYNHAFYQLRIFEARELEPNTGEFFMNGRKLYEGKSVLDIKIPWIVRKLRPKISLWLLIVFYDMAFICLAILNLPWLDC